MILRGHDSQGMTWYGTRHCDTTFQRYSVLLEAKGYCPLPKKGCFSRVGNYSKWDWHFLKTLIVESDYEAIKMCHMLYKEATILGCNKE